MIINFLSFNEIAAIHIHQINSYGGLHGIRDRGLLESALNYPQAMFQGKYLHPDIYHMTAAYMYSIIKNHPFVDGNKRTAIAVAILFLNRNNIEINATHDELFDLTIATTISKYTETNIALFFKEKSVKNAHAHS